MSDSDVSLAEALQRIQGVTLTEADIQAHVMRSPDVEGKSSDRGPDGHEPPEYRLPHPDNLPSFDGEAFCTAMQADLADAVSGYCMRMRENGTTIYTLEWNWAKEPQDGGEGWNPDVLMHIASCSKVLTAMGMTKLLAAKGIAPGTPIIDWLPAYWAKGENVGEVTFADLFTHKSGFNYGNNESPDDYEFIKGQVAAGTTHVGDYNYQNMNFGICRILLATINGNIPVDFNVGSLLNDVTWDAVTISAYVNYMNANVFEPSGVTNATTTHPATCALAYNFPVSGNGWNSGDLTTEVGGLGWHLSVDDMLNVMGTFRRAGTIVSTAQAQEMLAASFGIDWIGGTALGTYYAKNGGWGNGQLEQCAAFFLPNEMELVVFVNSPIGTESQFLMGEVATLFNNAITG
jgi:CubicO group peptidase (beta-lactamase class C family)